MDDEMPGVAFDRLLELTVLLGEDMTRGLARYGLTVSRTHLLWVVHHQGPSTQRVLAEALAVTPRTVTGLVDALVADGFVTREAHPTDRRAALVTLTAHGRATMAEMVTGRRQVAEELFAGMPPAELAGLVSGLDHVVARLQEMLRAAEEQS